MKADCHCEPVIPVTDIISGLVPNNPVPAVNQSHYVVPGTLALSKTACDIHLKHVFLTELGLWRNPAPKLRHIPFRFFGYHKLARTVVTLNISVFPA